MKNQIRKPQQNAQSHKSIALSIAEPKTVQKQNAFSSDACFRPSCSRQNLTNDLSSTAGVPASARSLLLALVVL
jgi:hypothetical protein